MVELIAERTTVHLTADRDMTLVELLAEEGQTLQPGAPLARLEAGMSLQDGQTPAPAAPAETPTEPSPGKEKPAMAEPKGDVTPLLMPKAGNSMEEGTIIEWKVSEGDTIEQGQIIYEVETDKAAVEVEADQGGRLARIVVGDGETIEVLQPVAYLAENDEDVDAYIARQGGGEESADAEMTDAPRSDAEAPAVAPKPVGPAAKDDTGRVKASPAARRIAAERGVDLAGVSTGSGPGGRVISTDVPAAGTAAAAPAPASKPVAAGEATTTKLSAMRKIIGQRLSESKQTIPHFYIEQTVDAGPLMGFYRQHKAQYPCSVNDVVVLACAKTIAEFPAFRSQLDGEQLITQPTANIGIAVGMDDGLVVPVLMAGERMNLQQVGAETRRLAEAARGGKIENRGQGVFTISNLGMFGIDRFSAIINPPEAAILAVGTVREEVIVQSGMMRPGQRMTVTLSCDHRIIDGLVAAKFLARLKQYLEGPQGLLG
jgi:pyruvate dehydrogenase E2 component (dihydrolipoamide acetyltransferase)